MTWKTPVLCSTRTFNTISQTRFSETISLSPRPPANSLVLLTILGQTWNETGLCSDDVGTTYKNAVSFYSSQANGTLAILAGFARASPSAISFSGSQRMSPQGWNTQTTTVYVPFVGSPAYDDTDSNEDYANQLTVTPTPVHAGDFLYGGFYGSAIQYSNFIPDASWSPVIANNYDGGNDVLIANQWLIKSTSGAKTWTPGSNQAGGVIAIAASFSLSGLKRSGRIIG